MDAKIRTKILSELYSSLFATINSMIKPPMLINVNQTVESTKYTKVTNTR